MMLATLNAHAIHARVFPQHRKCHKPVIFSFEFYDYSILLKLKLSKKGEIRYSEMSNYVGVRIILEDRFHDNKNRGVIAIRTSFGK